MTCQPCIRCAAARGLCSRIQRHPQRGNRARKRAGAGDGNCATACCTIAGRYEHGCRPVGRAERRRSRRMAGASVRAGRRAPGQFSWVRRTASLNCSRGYKRPCRNAQTNYQHSYVFPARAVRRCPLGGPKMPPRLRRGIGQGWANGQSDIEMRSRSCWLRERLPVGRGYAAAFFVGFDAGFGAAFLLAFPFSFAANSCLTVAEMASTSTL